MISIAGNAYSNWDDKGVLNIDNFVSVTSCGFQKFLTRNLKIKREAGRIDYQLIYISEGKGYFQFGDDTLEISKGNLVVFLPGQPQCYNYKWEDGTELYWIHFTGYAIKEFMEELGIWYKQVLYIGDNKECIELFKKITYELQLKRHQFIHYASAYLIEMLSSISRKQSEFDIESNITITDDIKKAILYMHAYYNKDVYVNELAKECNLSLFRFIHKFKASTGITPLQYLTKIRIDAAKDLLSNSSLSVSEVSSIIGYEDPLYFSKVFKSVTGISPRVFKNNLDFKSDDN